MINPPKFAIRFLRWFCSEEFIHEIEGDLMEVFRKQSQQSPFKAKIRFAWTVLKYIRPEFLKSFGRRLGPGFLSLSKHNLLITYRSFSRYKSSFFINLGGLSAGLAAVLLIYLWVWDEVSIDRFHEKDARLYQVLTNIPEGEIIHTSENNSDLLEAALTQEMPGVETVTTVAWPLHGVVSTGDKKFSSTGRAASKDFFNVFSYRIIEGNKKLILADKYNVVISDQLAYKLFGKSQGVVGKLVTLDEEEYTGIYAVAGVFEHSTKASDPLDFLITNAMYLDRRPPSYIGWHSNSLKAFVVLHEGVDPAAFNVKLKALYTAKLEQLDGPQPWNGTMFLVRYSDQYLYNRYENGVSSGGRIDYVILFSTIALFILIIACINFMNLSTARASRRLKEIGIKKAIGALRRTLISQYFTESIVMAFLALLIAIIAGYLLLPQFNLITGKHLTLSPSPQLVLGACVIALFTGLVSGSYPALYLSRMRPVEVLKGKLATSFREKFARKGLVVFQFSVSILLIVGVIVVYQQIRFVQSKDLGYKKDNLITFERIGKLNESLESFLEEAKRLPGIVNGTAISGDVTNFRNSDWGHSWPGQREESKHIKFTHARVGYDFIETLDAKMIEGRSFSKEFTNEQAKVILNETAIKAMQLNDPVGKIVNIRGEREVIGIVKDFHFKSLYEAVEPMYLIYNPQTTDKLIFRIETAGQSESIARLEKLYHDFNPGFPFEFRFVDDEYQALYSSEQRVGILSGYFAGIAVLVSCLGLFGLASFTAERRIKEIGIRKILGSSEFDVVKLLSADFAWMVLIAIGIALPLSFFAARNWLHSFAYRIDLQWWFFLGAGFTAFFVAGMTVGVQTLKAARRNPVLSLKTE